MTYADQTRSFRVLHQQASRDRTLFQGFAPNWPLSGATQRLLGAQLAPLTEAVNRLGRVQLEPMIKALNAMLPSLVASQRLAAGLAASPVFRVYQLGLSDAVLKALMANQAAALRALPDFARLLGTVQTWPTGTPAASAMREKPHDFPSDTVTVTETVDAETSESLGSLSRQQMRQVVVVYMYVIVFLVLVPVAVENPETVGVVTSIVGGNVREVASWCSNLIGQAFDTLYPPEE
ncbi:hypothetical protein AAH991_38075 [Microbispora sp. ZYX-F-249]|uniref:Uncharacterized protein n=1 Tax=Microbispora maris TaxID=3144104 RepID=A0ABV0B0D1_9ACTN